MKPDQIDKSIQTIRPKMKNKKVSVTAKPVIIPSTKTEKSTESSQTNTSYETENLINAEVDNLLRESVRCVSRLKFI